MVCASKDTAKKAKRQMTEWDKIFANHVPDMNFKQPNGGNSPNAHQIMNA